MIAIAGRFLRAQYGSLVNLDNVTEIDIQESVISVPERLSFDVIASWPARRKNDLGSTIVFRGESRGECDAYVAELFLELQNRDMMPLRGSRFSHLDDNGEPTYFSRGNTPQPK